MQLENAQASAEFAHPQQHEVGAARTKPPDDEATLTSVKGFNDFCEQFGPDFMPSYTTVSEAPFKVRVELAGRIFETKDYFSSRLKATRASAELAMQWLSDAMPHKVPSTPANVGPGLIPRSRVNLSDPFLSNFSLGMSFSRNFASTRLPCPRCTLWLVIRVGRRHSTPKFRMNAQCGLRSYTLMAWSSPHRACT